MPDTDAVVWNCFVCQLRPSLMLNVPLFTLNVPIWDTENSCILRIYYNSNERSWGDSQNPNSAIKHQNNNQSIKNCYMY